MPGNQLAAGLGIGCAILVCVSGTLAAADHVSWSEPGRCGTNVLYMMLQLSGNDVNYRDVYHALPTDPARGVSLEQMREVSADMGAHFEVRKVRFSDLAQLSGPFIAHLDLTDAGGGGHFIVVTAITEVADRHYEMVAIDGKDGRVIRQPLHTLAKAFLGYVLIDRHNIVASDGWVTEESSFVAGLIIGCAGIAAYQLFWRLDSRSSPQ